MKVGRVKICRLNNGILRQGQRSRIEPLLLRLLFVQSLGHSFHFHFDTSKFEVETRLELINVEIEIVGGGLWTLKERKDRCWFPPPLPAQPQLFTTTVSASRKSQRKSSDWCWFFFLDSFWKHTLIPHVFPISLPLTGRYVPVNENIHINFATFCSRVQLCPCKM